MFNILYLGSHKVYEKCEVDVKIKELEDALIHIADVAGRSRSQSRRDVWIQARAESAINGNDDWKDMKKPANPTSKLRRNRVEIKELSAHIERLRESIDLLRTLKCQAQLGCSNYRDQEVVWTKANKPYNETPAQSLAIIKADSIEEMLSSGKLEYSDRDGDAVWVDSIKEFAAQFRKVGE